MGDENDDDYDCAKCSFEAGQSYPNSKIQKALDALANYNGTYEGMVKDAIKILRGE
jgi:hypothetical protein